MSELSTIDTSAYGKCADCPFVICALKYIQEREVERDEIIMQAMDDDGVNQFVKMMNEAPSYLGFGERKSLTPESVREKSSEQDQEIVESIADEHQSITDRTRGCMGSVTLTGLTPDGRRQFSAQVCASPRISSRNTEETVAVQRERI